MDGDTSVVQPETSTRLSVGEQRAHAKDVIFAHVHDYDALVGALARRREQRDVSFTALGEVAGLASGYAAGLLGPSQTRKFGWLSIFLIMPLLGLRLALIEDEEAAAKFHERLSGRQGNQARKDNHAQRLSTRIISRVQRHLGKSGGKATALRSTPEERSARARHAARKRWVKPKVRELSGRRARRVREQTTSSVDE